MSGEPKKEQLFHRRFVWLQFDTAYQRLYVIYHRKNGRDERGHTVYQPFFTAIQFIENAVKSYQTAVRYNIARCLICVWFIVLIHEHIWYDFSDRIAICLPNLSWKYQMITKLITIVYEKFMSIIYVDWFFFCSWTLLWTYLCAIWKTARSQRICTSGLITPFLVRSIF